MPRLPSTCLLSLASALSLAALACHSNPRPAAAPADPVEVPAAGTGSPQGNLVSAPPTGTTPAGSATPSAPADTPPARPPIGLPGTFKCKLDAPKLSDDACSSDSDCAPSDPCHAHACVAASKANPGTPTTMCTRMMDCQSVDANRCGCYEGRCALIPPP